MISRKIRNLSSLTIWHTHYYTSSLNHDGDRVHCVKMVQKCVHFKTTVSKRRFRRAETLTKHFAQEQRLDQVELCVWGVGEGVADRRIMVQLKQWEREQETETQRERERKIIYEYLHINESLDLKLLTTAF